MKDNSIKENRLPKKGKISSDIPAEALGYFFKDILKSA